ncbi:transporter substrate-binding domain-containing protein [Archangium violaceum]|uniref:Transglycosylase n=1 Tax=Archangium violaceum Cb vi76 TaxID=1406225 RepID=A0A084SPP5_9BACT|nr:transporter substrate-binding domain-containing protein [Archangium violaceum]KFA90430.1 transglycosylase [Archangium violaceum Cb vi76]
MTHPSARSRPTLNRWLLAAALLCAVSACEGACAGEKAGPPGPTASASTGGEDDAFPEGASTVAAADERELPVAQGDLAEMKERGTLRILIEGTEEEFLPRQGSPKEQERALLERFARRHGMKAEFIRVSGFDRLIPLLTEGKGDIVAAEMTVTQARAERIAFTRPLAVVSEYVVGKKGAQDNPRSPGQLAGRKVHVRASSSYADSLRALAGEKAPGLTLEPVPENVEPEQLAYEVSRGQRPLTVLDSHLLAAIEAYNPDVERLFPIAEGQRLAWGLRKESPELKASLDGFLVENALTEYTSERFTGDLDALRKRGVLRVLTRNNPLTYFLYRGEPMGFDYQLAKAAADELGVRLEVVVPPSRDLLIPWLREGRGDFIAASLTITPERQAEVAFSQPYLYVDEVLVQRSTGPKAASPEELEGKKVHARKSSSYYTTLLALREKHGPFDIEPAPEDQETEVLLERVAAGELDFTVADSHILDAERVYRDDLEAGFTLPQPGPPGAESAQKEIAFAVRQENPQLRAFLDGFVKKTYRGVHYNMWRKRYFENKRHITRAKEERAGSSGRLSPYDTLIRKYSTTYGFDWRLMAAQAWRESHFDPKAKSWVGAQGLFQVMPTTGSSMGFTELEDPEQGTHAGVRYMHQMLGRLAPTIPFKHRLRFALAAYNVGLGHVLDARRLAAEQGLDPDKWFGHVEKAMLLLEKPEHYRRARHGYCRGSEPVRYVSDIQARYVEYVKVVQ